MLSKIENKMNDNDETHVNQLVDFSKKHLSTHFGGVVFVDPVSMFAYITEYPLVNGKFYLNLFNSHWTTVFNNGGLYQFDSFNRNLYGPKFKQITIKPEEAQKVTESTCGQHVLAKLMMTFKET